MNRSAKFQQIVRGMNQVQPETPSTAAIPRGLTPGPTSHTRPRRCWTCH